MQRRRDETLAKAKQLKAEGRNKDAREMFTRCVDITPELALQFIKVGAWLLSAPQ